jgi:hypothetical protein
MTAIILDYYMNDMIEVMKRNNCPQLSETDPRKVVDDKYSKTLREAIIKKKFNKISKRSEKRD